jgi:hypothetical protein
LLIDGCLWAKAAADAGTSDTLCWLLESTSGKLLHQYKNLSAFLEIGHASTSQPRNNLCQLLGLPAESFTDPQSLKDLCQCLDVQNIRDRGGIIVVREAHQEECFQNGKRFFVEAKTDKHGQIYYRNPICINKPLQLHPPEKKI